MSKVQTDNSFFYEKCKLRLDNLPDNDINVLDLFHGDGKIWKYLKKNHKYCVNVVGIDIKDKEDVYLKGDNLKYIEKIDIDNFDIIDVDAYGVPFKQLDLLFKKSKKEKIYFVTCIQSMFGGIPHGLLEDLGYTKQMIKKIPSMFNKNGLSKFKSWLALKGISNIKSYEFNNKLYCYFKK